MIVGWVLFCDLKRLKVMDQNSFIVITNRVFEKLGMHRFKLHKLQGTYSPYIFLCVYIYKLYSKMFNLCTIARKLRALDI